MKNLIILAILIIAIGTGMAFPQDIIDPAPLSEIQNSSFINRGSPKIIINSQLSIIN